MHGIVRNLADLPGSAFVPAPSDPRGRGKQECMAETELHQRIFQFLMAEWNRKDNRQLEEVHLVYAPGNGFAHEPIRRWVRTDEPELFVEIANVEKLVMQILEFAEGEADAKPAGKHRFVIRTKQTMGERATMSFALAPTYKGEGDDEALIVNGGGSGGGGGGGGGRGSSDVAIATILSNNNAQLMRTNTQMFDGTIRVLGHQVQNLHERIIELTGENATLRRRLEEAESSKDDRDFQRMMAHDKSQRSNAALQKVLQLGTVVMARFGGEGGSQLPEGNPMGLLISEFYQSLRQEQMASLLQTLDMPQKIMFFEIVKLVQAQQEKGSGPGGPGGPPGGAGPR